MAAAFLRHLYFIVLFLAPQQPLAFQRNNNVSLVRIIKPSMSAFLHYVEDDATPSSIKQKLSDSPLSLVVAVASFAPKCKVLLRDIVALEKEYEGGSCCGPSPTKPYILVIKTDASGTKGNKCFASHIRYQNY